MYQCREDIKYQPDRNKVKNKLAGSEQSQSIAKGIVAVRLFAYFLLLFSFHVAGYLEMSSMSGWVSFRPILGSIIVSAPNCNITPPQGTHATHKLSISNILVFVTVFKKKECAAIFSKNTSCFHRITCLAKRN